MPSRTRSLSCGWRGGGGGHLRDPTRRPQDSNFRSCGRVRSGGHVYRPIRHHGSRYYGSPQDSALSRPQVTQMGEASNLGYAPFSPSDRLNEHLWAFADEFAYRTINVKTPLCLIKL